MINKEGTFIAHPDENRVLNQENDLKNTSDAQLKEIRALESKMVAGEKGWGEYTFDGITKVLAFAPVDVNNWSVAVCATKKELIKVIQGDITQAVDAAQKGSERTIESREAFKKHLRRFMKWSKR